MLHVFRSPGVRRALITMAVYAVVICVAFSAASLSLKAQDDTAPQPQGSATPAPTEVKPYFSLSTNRTYGTSDRARVWINYRGVDHLDFRVYRVREPVQFFKQLSNPHRMGEREKSLVAAAYRSEPSLLEKIRAFKVSVFTAIKGYFRKQLKRTSRETFNQKFRGDEERRPLNVADYARVPLLNPDQLVGSWRQPLSPLDNEWDTRMVLLGKRDPGVYLVEAVNSDLRAYTIAIVADLAILTKSSQGGDLLVYTVNRKTGEPRQDAKVIVTQGLTGLAAGTSDRDGIMRAHVDTASRARQNAAEDQSDQPARKPTLVMASAGDDFAIGDLQPYYYYGDVEEEPSEEGGSADVVGYIYTERPVYRPNQKVYFKGILRRLGEAGYEALQGGTVSVIAEDPNNAKVIEKELPLSPRGTFAGEVEISGTAPLGSYRIIANINGSTASGYFEVQEYKKPEYKVAVETPKKFVPIGEKVKFTIEARYFFGAPVTTADVQYYIYRSRYYHPWWTDEGDDLGVGEESEDEYGYYGYGNDMVGDGQATLDKNGRAEVTFEIPEAGESDYWDYSYRLEAQVTDASRRTMEARASVVATRGDVVARIQSDRWVYYQDDNARITINTSNYEGKPVAARVTLKFVQRTWQRVAASGDDSKRYEYESHERELASADVNTNDQGYGTYTFKVPVVGSIHVKTIVHQGKKEIASMGEYIWVADREDRWADFAYEDYGSIKLVPDKKSYKPGETAHVLAMLPAERAHLLVTTELAGIMSARRVEAKARAVMIDVPIEQRYSPNVYLSVSFVKDGDMYTHDKLLNVPASHKFLNIEIMADKPEYKPRDVATYTVFARNPDGQPAPGAEISLGIVDEAIYSIRPDQTTDIRRAFYGRRYNQVQTMFSISYEFSGYSGDDAMNLARNKPAYQLADFKNEGQYAEPTIRKDFKDTTFWQPDILTGPDGKATVKVTLPDNLTTWRATARAVTADTRVGSSVGKVVARKDLILRVETPRFLTEGDTVTISGIVHNYLNADKSTNISIEVTGAQLLDAAAQTVAIAKQGQHRIDWRVRATQLGDVRLLAKARTDAESDAVELPLPVVPHGLRQTVGGSMTLSDAAAEKTLSLDLPANANPQARALRIEASPSVAATLFGALDYLTSYPYGCVEQTMSGFIPNIAVAQALKDVKTASLRASNNLDKKVQRGLDRLYSFQHDDGGWGWWKYDETDPFMTAYVIDGLMLASRAGYQIDMNRVNRARENLKQMIDSGKTGRGWQVDQETRSFMVYALVESGNIDHSYVNNLFAVRRDLQPYGRALLAITLKLIGDDSRARQVASEIESSAQVDEFTAHWQSTRRPMLDFREENNTEATALSLKALIRINPQSSLLPKVVRWMVTNRPNGYYWESTKQTAFAILSLIEYLKVSKELSAEYTLEIYLNGQQVIARNITPADAASAQPIVFEQRGAEVAGASQIKVVKRGQGMLYLSSTLDYFTKEDDVAARGSNELTVSREYLRLRVEESDGQAKWKLEPLTGQVRSGDLIVARLRLKGAVAQYLMIEDPIPAGCEQVERVSGINLDYNESNWCDWYNAREFRDQKTTIFLDYFDGNAVFQYAMRVQIPGEFKVAPARAELMYRPTLQSNTASTRLTILDK